MSFKIFIKIFGHIFCKTKQSSNKHTHSKINLKFNLNLIRFLKVFIFLCTITDQCAFNKFVLLESIKVEKSNDKNGHRTDLRLFDNSVFVKNNYCWECTQFKTVKLVNVNFSFKKYLTSFFNYY